MMEKRPGTSFPGRLLAGLALMTRDKALELYKIISGLQPAIPW